MDEAQSRVPPTCKSNKHVDAVLGCTTVPFELRTCPKVKLLKMSTNKAALKSIGSAIQARNYDDAVSQAQKLLANDPQHYQGFVNALFLIFAVVAIEQHAPLFGLRGCRF